MSTQKADKLKNVLQSVPSGFIVDSAWLTSQGVSRFLTQRYLESGWLERAGHGVFRRPAPENSTRSETLDWKTGVLSAQHIMGYQLHVGGTTALNLQGHSHYLSLGTNASVWLYGDDTPNWLAKLPLNASLTLRKGTLFADATVGVNTESPSTDETPNLPWNWALRMSSPERAVLEALNEVPDHESFHGLDMIFEGLTNLRPKLLTALLENCTKIKVKRLFFVFADRHNHAWRKRLNPDVFDLGSGDRALVRGGRLHPTYRIMVPSEFVPSKTEASDGA